MTTPFLIISLLIAGYRIKKGLFTRVEWLILLFWCVHFCLEQFQLIAEGCCFKYDARYFRPAEFLLWPWMAWGIAKLWSSKIRFAKPVILLAGILIAVYDGVLVVKARLPIGRRSAYIAACDWAAEKIRADWKGLAVDPENRFSLYEYHIPNRPCVWAHVARLPYEIGGRNFPDVEEFKEAPDYWIDDLRVSDPPTEGYVLLDTFKRGKYEFPLYKRVAK